MRSLSGFRQLLVCGGVAAALFAAVAVSAGCTDSPKQRQPPNGQAATATVTALRQQLEYLVTKTFTAAEFEKWVDGAEQAVANATGIAAEVRSLEAAIRAASGKGVRIKLAESIEPPGIFEAGEEYRNASVEIGGRYLQTRDEILLLQKDPLSRIGDFTKREGRALVTKLHYKLHELYHNLSDMHSEFDTIDTLIAQHSLSYVQVDVKGLPVLLIVPGGFDKSKSETQGYSFAGKLFFDALVPEAEAEALLASYKGSTSIEEAEQDLGNKLRGIWTAQLANKVITEAQAYFAQPLADEVRADKLELQVSVVAAVPQQKGPHVDYAKKAVDEVVRGYAALIKSGVTRTEANIRMAVLAGKSMAISQNEFEPYERLQRNVSALITQLKVKEHTQAEVSDLLLQRKRHHEELSTKMAGSLSDYIVSTLVWPFVGPRLPTEFGGVANVFPTGNFNFQEISGGTYQFTTTAVVTKAR